MTEKNHVSKLDEQELDRGQTSGSCKCFLNNNKDEFGISEVPEETCLDICVQNVRYICNNPINIKIPLPSAEDIFQNCRGIVDFPGDIDTNYCEFRVTCAREELVDCNTDNPGVRVMVKGQVILKTLPQAPGDKPSFIALPIDILDTVCRTFYRTADGEEISNLKYALRFIDGSCVVAQLDCNIIEETVGCYKIAIEGNVVDKLWKDENIWVRGIRPYAFESITVSEEFPGQKLTCTPVCNGSNGNNMPV